MQMAQLKVRPGRQYWELAPDFFKRTAFSTDDEISAIRGRTIAERTASANELKEKGNAVFSQVSCGRRDCAY